MRTREQQRALYAYQVVASVPKNDRADYKTAVNALGANVLRSGLAAAIAAVERMGGRGSLLMKHLAEAGVPGLAGATANDVPNRIRQLNVDEYIFATREILRVTTWLKRASQATFGEQ